MTANFLLFYPFSASIWHSTFLFLCQEKDIDDGVSSSWVKSPLEAIFFTHFKQSG